LRIAYFRFEQGDVLIDEMDVPWPFDLGNHDHVELVANVLDDLLEVVEDPRAVQGIDAHPHRGIGEVVIGQQLDEAGARRVLGLDRDGVLEVAAHHVALPRRFRRLGADLVDVRRKEMDHSFRPDRQFTQGLWRTNGERLVEMYG
jgi:hypothetical protein